MEHVGNGGQFLVFRERKAQFIRNSSFSSIVIPQFAVGVTFLNTELNETRSYEYIPQQNWKGP